MFKDFGVFIINDKKGSLKFYNGPGFSNEYSKPQFNNNGGDLVGVNFNRQTISFTVGVYWISVEKYRELMNCLDPLVTDYIIFDFEPRYRYNVKLSKIGDSTRWIVGYENGEPRYYTELSLTFDLQGDSCAKGVHSYEDNRSTGSNSSEVIITIDTTKKEFFESDLDTPFTISLPFLLAKEDTSDATKIIDEISLKATYDNEEINLFSVGLCNLNQQNYQSYPQTNIQQIQQPVSNQMIPNQIYQNNQLYNGQYNVQPQNKVQFGPTNVS